MIVPPRTSIRSAPAGTAGAPAAGPAYVIRPSTITSVAAGTGGAPVPSINWPLVMIVVPAAVFMGAASCRSVAGETQRVVGRGRGGHLLGHKYSALAPVRRL